MENKLVKIGVAAKMLGTTPGTLRKWENTGELLPFRKTAGGTRYYSVMLRTWFCNYLILLELYL
jgi:DNA-binding transcriptional MerR regulator